MTAARRAGTASAAALPALALALGLAHVAAPEWVRRAGLDVWNYAALREAARAGDCRRVALEIQQEQLFQEIEATTRLAERLAAGSVSLAEATDATEPILRDRTGFADVGPRFYPAPTFRLTVARYLIERVKRGQP